MERKSTRVGNGWISAILVAICLFLIFCLGNSLANLSRKNYRDPRTAVLQVSVAPKTLPKIATANLPLGIEPLDPIWGGGSWQDYKSEANHSLSLVEPTANARLVAPVAPEKDSVLGPWDYARNPNNLAQSAADISNVQASLVSSLSDAESLSNRDHSSTDGTSPVSRRRNWPHSPQLKQLLSKSFDESERYKSESVRIWLNALSERLETLSTLEIKDPMSESVLRELRATASDAAKTGLGMEGGTIGLHQIVATVSYAIERRCAVWEAIHRCVSQGHRSVTHRSHDRSLESMAHHLTILEESLTRIGDSANWKRYLMLDALVELSQRGTASNEERVRVAREFLTRVMDVRLSATQQQLLRSTEIQQLAEILHPLAIGPVDYIQLLEDVETLESDPTHRCSKSLSEAMQCLRFSEIQEQSAIGQAIESHYRNANIRIAVSEELTNRLIPNQAVAQKPVRQTILGAETRGASQIATKLRVDFEPDASAWRIGLKLNGDISSNTKSSRNGATFYNSSRANVQAAREIRIEPTGFHVDGRPATVESNDALRKFSTDWDELPVLGDMIRRIAHQEFLESRPVAKRITQNTIARETDRELNKQLQSKLRMTQDQLESRIIGPLQGLQLDPSIMDMQSTETRLIVRYRVASEQQTAAHTARPIAPSDSLISMQIHQSAFNNTASQVIHADRDWTIQELADQIADLLKQPRVAIHMERAEDIRVRFHPLNPITVEFTEGKLWLTLRIDSLEQPGRIQLKNFSIRACYSPVVDVLQASLERDGAISVDGHRLGAKDKVPLRAIFSNVLSDKDPIPVVADWLIQDPRARDLAVSQLEMREGWLAIAISDKKSPQLASNRHSTTQP